ncbi:MAG: radical SAM protein [Candidatus Riflebacteria bacterium]|nr:radical SAM protein [Candidatus Riflebacteria bacterium]
MSPSRAFNLAVNLTCAFFRTRKVPGFPYVLRLDPTNVCNFSCSLCPTGRRNYGRPPGLMPWNTYKKAVDQLSPWIIRIWYYIWGEPLLHPELPRMIAYAVKRGLSTNLSSNFSRMTPELAKDLINSGLEYIIASIDGADEKTYHKYRQGGSFQDVIQNLKMFLDVRRGMRSQTPFVEFQCLMTADTENQVDAITSFALDLGVDRVRFMPLAVPFFPYRGQDVSQYADWFPKKPETYRYQYEPGKPANPGHCFWLYEGLTLNPDGGVSPCCRSYFKNEDFGNILEEPIRTIFNNEKFQRSRSLFSSYPHTNGEKNVCDGCKEFLQTAKS